MAGGDDQLAGNRGPLLYVVFAAAGIVGAIVLAMLLGGGDERPVTAVGSPGASVATHDPGPSGSDAEASASVEPSLAAASNEPPTPDPTVAPTRTPEPTEAPTPTPTPTPRKTAKPTPTPNTDPAIVEFKVPATEDCTNDTARSIHISWTIARATAATLSIEGGLFDTYSGTSQSLDVPFGCEHDDLTKTYTLTTIGGNGPPVSVTKTVKAAAPRIKTFELGPAECPSTDPGTTGVAFAYEITAATGAQLLRDGAVYANYSSKEASGSTVAYDCTKESQTFVLTTTGGYGEEASKQLVVRRSLP